MELLMFKGWHSFLKIYTCQQIYTSVGSTWSFCHQLATTALDFAVCHDFSKLNMRPFGSHSLPRILKTNRIEKVEGDFTH